MKVLGLHTGHDASAALVVDGEVVADVAEERFSRIKHRHGMPVQAMAYALKEAGIEASDLDQVAIPALNSAPELNRLLQLTGAQQEQPRTAKRLLNLAFRATGRSQSEPPLYYPTFPVNPRCEVVHVEHHLAHAASAYYTCGSDERFLVVTCDGIGDGVSLAFWRGEGGKLTPIERYGSEGSLGWFYSNVTEALGWWHGDGEGKTMGLAPYGEEGKLAGVLDGLYPVYEKGRLVTPHDFGTASFWNEGGALQYHLPESEVIQELIGKHGREDIAAEAQRVLEEQLKAAILPRLHEEGTRNLACAGGVFLNVKLNQKLWYSGELAQQHIFPNAGDSGLAVGAAPYAYHQAQPSAPIGRVDHVYWGSSYDDEEIGAELSLCKVDAERLEDPCGEAARELADGKILGWFQGRMESGPRALGNRSILMSPCHPDHKDIINARVKFREAFRPFCPSLTIEAMDRYLVKARPERYMVTSFECKEERRAGIPAVVHEDGTLRPQTVEADANPRYHSLIRQFGELSGEPIVLNTSFNVMGEPIVRTPRDALRCFFSNGLDTLYLGNYRIRKTV